MRTDVGNRAKLATILGKDAPVEIRLVEQPVLRIAAGHMKQLTNFAAAHALRRFDAKWIVADVVVHAGGNSRLSSQINQFA